MLLEIKRDIEWLKVAISNANPGTANTQDESVFRMLEKPLTDVTDFNSFNDKLKDHQFYKNLVSNVRKLISGIVIGLNIYK